MKYKCCEYLLHQIVFDQDEIKPCCATSMNSEIAKFVENFDGKNFDLNKYVEKRNFYVEKFKTGEVPDCCLNCPMIEEKEWEENEIYFDRIIMANIAKCSCNCIYCVYTYHDESKKLYYNTRSHYDIKPILQKLRDQNLIHENLVLIIGGGECTEFPKGELEWLIYYTTFYKGRVQILSSGIIYSEAISQILKTGSAELSISPDAGTKKMYEKIKRVKAFDRVWGNLKEYIAAVKGNPKSRVEIKYIIIPNVNDNKREVMAFIEKCRSVGCENIHVDIEHHWFSENKNKNIPKNIKDIIELFQSQKEFFVSFSVETEEWLTK